MKQNTLLIIIITIISLLAVFSYLSSPFFNLHNIIINDLEYISEMEIKNKLSDYLQQNIWLISRTGIKKKLYEHRYIKSISVKKKYPDSIKLIIVERIPVAKINNNGKYTVFTADGFILEEGAMKTSHPVPLITGTGYSFSGLKLIFSDKINEIVQALKNIEREIRTNIREINIDNNKFYLKLDGDSQPEVYMGELEDIKRKFTTFNSIYIKITDENLDIHYIDLGVVDKPVISR